MTRIEKVLNTFKNEILETDCPENYVCGGPMIDRTAVMIDEKTQNIIGCRGITCEECWNQGVNDAQI